MWATLAEHAKKKSDRRYFMRGVLNRVEGAEHGAPVYEARLSGRQSSAMLSSMHRAGCLISLPEGLSSVPAGTVVECTRLDQEEGTP
jgi:molybdopterin biosynthesis enzyme